VYDWLLFLHLLAAFILVAAVVLFGSLLLSTSGARGETVPLLRLSRLAELLWNVGGLSVLVFGIWLAIDLDGYDIFDGWIVAAVVLWLIASGAGARVAAAYREALDSGSDAPVLARRSVVLHVVMATAALALLVDMILKPGAS
jgi:uncharacterized membrane protein